MRLGAGDSGVAQPADLDPFGADRVMGGAVELGSDEMSAPYPTKSVGGRLARPLLNFAPET
jgi:hypothetical protein